MKELCVRVSVPKLAFGTKIHRVQVGQLPAWMVGSGAFSVYLGQVPVAAGWAEDFRCP